MSNEQRDAFERYLDETEDDAERQFEEIERMEAEDRLRLNEEGLKAYREAVQSDERHAARERDALAVVRDALRVVDVLDPWAETDEGEPFRRDSPLDDARSRMGVVHATCMLSLGVASLLTDVLAEYECAGIDGGALTEVISALQGYVDVLAAPSE